MMRFDEKIMVLISYVNKVLQYNSIYVSGNGVFRSLATVIFPNTHATFQKTSQFG